MNWEYKVIEIDLEGEPGEDIKEKIESFLNRVGEIGWEFVEYIQGSFPLFILRREKVKKRGRPKKKVKK